MTLDKDSRQTEEKAILPKPRGLLADIRAFFIHKPAIPTLIKFDTEAEREDYSQRILQRIGVSVTEYSVLNIHRIGIDAPVRFVFEELMKWDGQVSYWPNHIVTAYRVDGRLEHIQFHPLGRARSLFGLKDGFLGLTFPPLFDLRAWKFQEVPSPSEQDNARYLLYKCGGGYPIGMLAIYVRSPIAEQGEVSESQVFFGVGFDFYGKKDWRHQHIVNPVWEAVHNKVTANVLNRLKQLCEAKFQKVVDGEYNDLNMSRSVLALDEIQQSLSHEDS